MMRAAPQIEEAPVARAGPRSPDVFSGEEAGAALKKIHPIMADLVGYCRLRQENDIG